MDKKQDINDFDKVRANVINEYLKSLPVLVREQMVEIIMSDICIHCSAVVEGVCHCMNDD